MTAFFFLVGLGHLVADARPASADSLRGILEFGYSSSDGEARDSSGETRKTETSSFIQRYRITVNKTFFPQLFLTAGGLFERAQTDSETGSLETKTTDTKTRPFFDLRLISPLYQAGVGYSRREEKRETSGFPSTTDVNEEYHATAGWKPEGFPDWNIRAEKVDTFDKARVSRDTTTERVLMAVHYAAKGFDLRYQPSYSDMVERIDDLEIKEVAHNARASYSGSLFQKRVTLSASFEVTRTESEITSGGAGEVSFPLFPLSGLSAIDDSPVDGPLAPNPALIDGNLAASAGLNLGLPPPGGETRPRNIGLDFVNMSEANTLRVWVDRELPLEIANVFSWEIYASPDNLEWTLAATVSPAPFGPFENRFEIRFPNVTSRYLKVVTRPLAATVPRASEFPDIFVTEVQAFLRRPAAEVSGKATRTTKTGSADIRTRLLDRPSLYHEFSFFLIETDPPPRTRYTILNGLSASHRFSRIFSGSGRVTREDVDDPVQSGVIYTYTASLQAVPLRTLRHTLLASARNEQLGEESQDKYFLSLQNTAQLYRGIDVFLNGSLGKNTSETGEKQDIATLNAGATFVPHRTMTLALNFFGTATDRTGGGKPDQSTTDQRADISLAYRPFETLYLLASVSRIDREDRKETLQNYAANWSPFPSGALQFNFAFNQDLTTIDNAKTRSIRPSLRWSVTRRIIFDLSYQVVETESAVQSTDNRTFASNLQIFY